MAIDASVFTISNSSMAWLITDFPWISLSRGLASFQNGLILGFLYPSFLYSFFDLAKSSRAYLISHDLNEDRNREGRPILQPAFLSFISSKKKEKKKKDRSFPIYQKNNRITPFLGSSSFLSESSSFQEVFQNQRP